MRDLQRHSVWAVGGITLVLLSFLAGTSLACFQKSAENVRRAETCCKEHCQHAMEADTAAKCCQSHQATVSQILPAFSSTKAAALTAHTLHVALVSLVVLQDPKQLWTYSSAKERPLSSPPLYAFHCTLLI